MSEVVGKVSVKVVPDTSTFRRELEAQLKSLNDKMDIRFGADTSRIRKEVEAATKGLPDGKVQVDVEVNKNKQLIDDALTGLRQRIIDVPLDAKMRKGWHEEIQAEIDAARALSFDAELASEGVRQHLAFTLTELQAAAALNPVEIPVKLDFKARSLAGLSAVGSTVSGAFSGIAGLGGSAVSSLAGVAPMLLAIAAAATLVAPALALVSGALTLIPAAVAGFAAPIGAIVLGLDGIKKAAENAGLTGTETGKRGKVTTTLGEQLQALKTAVSGTFETALTAPFEKLNNIIPKLTDPLKSVATGLSSMADGFISSISSVDGMRAIQNAITNIGKGLQNAGPGIKAFMDGILVMVDKVAQRFPGLGEGFSRLGEQFLGWVNKFTGETDAFGKTGLDNTLAMLKNVWDQISGLGGDLLSKGFEWASDPNFGESISGFFRDVRSFVTETLPSLKDGFVTLSGIIEDIAPAFKQIGDGLGTIGDIGQILRGETSGITDLVDRWWPDGADTQAAEQIGKDMADGVAAGVAAGSKLGADVLVPADVGTIVQQQIAGQIAAASGPTKEALQETITANGIDANVATQLTQQVEAAIQGAKDAVGRLGPELQTKIDDSMLVLAGIGAKVGEAFTLVGPATVAGLQPAIDAVKSLATQINQTLSSSLGGNMYATIQGAFSGAAGAVNAGLNPAVQAVATAATAMLQSMASGLAAVTAVVEASFSAVPAVISGQMAAAVGAVASSCQLIVSTMLSFTGAAESAGMAIGASFAAGLGSAGGLVAGAASSLVGMARAYFPNSPADKGPFSGSGWIDNSGMAVGEAFAGGMIDASGIVGGAAGKMMDSAAQAIADKQKDITKQSEDLAKSIALADQGGIKIGSIPTGIKTGGLSEQKAELQVAQDRMDLQIKQLELDKLMAGDKGSKAAVQAQIDELKTRRDALKVQKEQLDLAGKQGMESTKMADSIDTAFNTMTKMPMDLALANANQFMSDIGMSGQGLLPSLMGEGLGMLGTTIFNISGVGEALSIDKRRQSTQALQFA